MQTMQTTFFCIESINGQLGVFFQFVFSCQQTFKESCIYMLYFVTPEYFKIAFCS